jgi:hypothetical protein
MSCIEDLVQEIGTLRRSWKITKLDDDRYKEIDTAQSNLSGEIAPIAAMVADVSELPLAATPKPPHCGSPCAGLGC